VKPGRVSAFSSQGGTETVWNLVLAQAQETAPAADSGAAASPGNPMSSMLIMFLGIIAIMYFLTIRPNQKREKERQQMLAALAKGDKVVTSGGICGSVVGLSEKTVVLRVSDEPTVKMEFLRGAISSVTARASEDKD
jgi:preprotein translocase subunit YajC